MRKGKVFRAKRNHKTYYAWITQGRGQGRGASYRPWLMIRDVPSIGERRQVFGVKTLRDHHLMSNLEYWFYLTLVWLPWVTDILEQFPHLDFTRVGRRRPTVREMLSASIECAQQAGYRHHTITGVFDAEGVPEEDVPTTDFVFDALIGGKTIRYARTVKQAADFEDRRTLQKFEIERRWWSRLGVDWAIVTEHEIPLTLANNIHLLYQHMLPTASLAIDDALTVQVGAALTDLVVQNPAPLARLAEMTDFRFQLDTGTSLAVAYHLLATRQWCVDMYKPIEPCEPIILLATHSRRP
jgi:hypothetical protein